MAFPASPSNNDVHKEGNRSFVYDSTLGVWDQVKDISSAPVAPPPFSLPHSSSYSVEGAMYYDSTSGSVKVRNASGWESLAASGGGTGTGKGGTLSTSVSGYRIHTFTTSGADVFEITGSSLVCDILIVGGGGGGHGGYQSPGGGGGGAGGFVYYSQKSLPTGLYTVIVGAGGTAGNADGVAAAFVKPTNGGDSSFGSLTVAVGGGNGSGFIDTPGSIGGSGGGGSYSSVEDGYAGTANQGNAGGNGYNTGQHSGGGGGAAAAGSNGASGASGDGGAGYTESSSTVYDHTLADGSTVLFNINDTENGYAGGGGGGNGYNGEVVNANYGSATHGGGRGGINNGSNTLGALKGYNGSANTGGGGGGGGGIVGANSQSDGGSGGSGIVIVRYAA